MTQEESFFLKNYKYELSRMKPDEIERDLLLPAIDEIITQRASTLDPVQRCESVTQGFISEEEFQEPFIELGYWKMIRALVSTDYYRIGP